MSTWSNESAAGRGPADYYEVMGRLWPQRVQAIEERIANGELPSRTVEGLTPDQLREQNPDLLREINHEQAMDLIHEHGIRADSRQAAAGPDYYWGAGMPQRAYAGAGLEVDEVVPDDTVYYVDRADAWYNLAKTNGEYRDVVVVDSTDRLTPLSDHSRDAETWRDEMAQRVASADYGVSGTSTEANQQREQLAHGDLLHHLIDRDRRQLDGETVPVEELDATLFTRLVAEHRGNLELVATSASWAGLHDDLLPSLEQANELREHVQAIRAAAQLPPASDEALDRQLGLWATYPEALRMPLVDQLTTGLGSDRSATAVMDRWYRAGQLLDTHEQALARNDPAAIEGPEPRVAQLLREHDGYMERTLTDPRFEGIVADDMARRGIDHSDEQVVVEMARIARGSGVPFMAGSPDISTMQQASAPTPTRSASGTTDAGDPAVAGRTEELLRSARANIDQARAILADDTPRTPARETDDQAAIVTLTSMSLGNVQQGIAVATGVPAPREASMPAAHETLSASDSPLRGTVQRQADGGYQVRAFANGAALQRLTTNAGQLRDLDVTVNTITSNDPNWQRQATRLHLDQAAQSLDRTANIAPGRTTSSEAPDTSSSRYDWDTSPAQPSRSVKR